jgi:hypothetical protein
VVAYRLSIGRDGRLRGNAVITHNSPWPCPNGQFGITPPMNGAVLHTMVGSLPGTVTVFNNAGFQASAHFGIGGPWSNTDGQIWQFGPAHGWEAWHVEAGNNSWFGIEHEDGGDPKHPLTDAQVTASAQVLEALSAQGAWGFPLREANTPDEHGYGVHYMGGANWGGHPCPLETRAAQRPEILRRARILRAHGRYPASDPVTSWTADGKTSLIDLSGQVKLPASTILRLTVDHFGAFSPELSHWIQAGDLTAPVPDGQLLVTG